jgi:ribonuclease VapC
VILDSSAILAIMLEEPEHAGFLGKIDGAENVGIGTPTLVESAIVLTRRWPDAERRLLDFAGRAQAVTITFGETHWLTAARAWQVYGKGRHPAGLNFGDCLTYAIAKVAGEPLLAKGDDFAKTDLALA